MIHFKESEFNCPCSECSLDFEDMDEDFVMDLDRARGYAEVPFNLTSSIRCMKHNLKKSVGGSKTSSHPKGYAADISAASSYEKFRIFHGLKKAGFNRIGIGKDFIHGDKDPDKPKELLWVY
ncbi:MAG: peptidase M15 [Desulfobacula sp.]|nr:peptidase M15 [Desulfobacula sp.]